MFYLQRVQKSFCVSYIFQEKVRRGELGLTPSTHAAEHTTPGWRGEVTRVAVKARDVILLTMMRVGVTLARWLAPRTPLVTSTGNVHIILILHRFRIAQGLKSISLQSLG